MNRFTKVLVLVIGVVALAACSSTKDEEMSDGAVSAGGQGVEGVSVGTGGGANVSGSALPGVTGAGNDVATVFYFDFDQSTLKPEARDALLQHAEALKSNGESVRLEGHADERGTREYNIALGERRANAVAQFLTLQGVSPSQLEVISYGEEKPAVLGTSDSAWAQNRRVELTR